MYVCIYDACVLSTLKPPRSSPKIVLSLNPDTQQLVTKNLQFLINFNQKYYFRSMV